MVIGSTKSITTPAFDPVAVAAMLSKQHGGKIAMDKLLSCHHGNNSIDFRGLNSCFHLCAGIRSGAF